MLKTGWDGLIGFGKASLLLAPVDVGDLQLLAGEARRMQHDEASAVGHEVGLGRGDRGEDERAVARAGDARLVGEPLSGVRANRAIRDGETFGSLLNVEIFDLRRVGAPILVAHQKRDAAQRLRRRRSARSAAGRSRVPPRADRQPSRRLGGSIAVVPQSFTARDGGAGILSLVMAANLEEPFRWPGRTARRVSG